MSYKLEMQPVPSFPLLACLVCHIVHTWQWNTILVSVWLAKTCALQPCTHRLLAFGRMFYLSSCRHCFHGVCSACFCPDLPNASPTSWPVYPQLQPLSSTLPPKMCASKTS
eukprot:scaffold262849_cov22-Tisochrysis_lutea.AAC.1